MTFKSQKLHLSVNETNPGKKGKPDSKVAGKEEKSFCVLDLNAFRVLTRYHGRRAESPQQVGNNRSSFAVKIVRCPLHTSDSEPRVKVLEISCWSWSNL